MKRIILALIVAGLLATALCGCKKEAAETPKKAQEYNEEILVEKLTELNDEWYYDCGVEGYAVPQFNVDSKAAEELNLELEKKYTDISKKGKDGGYLYVEMTVSVYKNLAFILVETTLKDDVVLYEAYSISLGTGERASNSDVYRCFGVSKVNCYGSVYDAISNEYKVYFHSFSDSSAGEYSKYKKKTLSEDNIYASTLYINERGQLSAVGKLYSIDGKTEISCAVAAIDPPLKKASEE